MLVAPNLIVTIRHFIDQGTINPSGNCDTQQNNWYAYFRGCGIPGGGSSCANICYGPNEDMIRVRIKCFTLAIGEFTNLLPGEEPQYRDAIVVAEIEPADVPQLCNITPIPVARPNDINLCMGQTLFLAGWGQTFMPGSPCDEVETSRLHVGTTSVSHIACTKNGRWGQLYFQGGSCGQTGCGLVAIHRLHDSGGGVIAELPDQTLRLVATLQTFYPDATLSARHQAFTLPGGSEFVCRPCRPLPCGDVNGDGYEECLDQALLDGIEPRQVTPWCVGDMDGDGCAATDADVNRVFCREGIALACDNLPSCLGDANLDGYITIDDLELIQDIQGSPQGSIACPTCPSCESFTEWCRGDINFDGYVNAADANIVASLLATNQAGYQCSLTSPGCGPGSSCE